MDTELVKFAMERLEFINLQIFNAKQNVETYMKLVEGDKTSLNEFLIREHKEALKMYQDKLADLIKERRIYQFFLENNEIEKPKHIG